PWLHALTLPKKNYIRFAKRAGTLARWHVIDGQAPEAPYLLRHQVPLKHAVYSRTERGDRLVNELNPLRTKEPFGHQLLQDMAQASIEIGARKHPGFQLVPWPELRDQGWKEHGKMQYVPDHALNAGDPHLIKVPTGHTRTDGAPFLLKHDGYQLFILGKE